MNYTQHYNTNHVSRNIVLVEGDISRYYMDLNRRISIYTTEFRKNIRELVIHQIEKIIKNKSLNANNIIYIIDCHSFPNYNNKFINNDVVILLEALKDYVFASELIIMLKQSNIKTTIFKGEKNDIMDEFNQWDREFTNIKIIPILLEINESITEQNIKIVCKVINEWINKINKMYVQYFNLLENFTPK